MEDDQQFCLRWNNHQSTLIAVFDTLLENGTLVDCTLAAEGKYLNAHKVVLSACSPYFESLLSQNYDKHPIFILKDVKFQELKAMMDYMYRGEVNISQDQLSALLRAAESLQIKGLSDNRGKSSGGGGGAGSSATSDAGDHPTPAKKQAVMQQSKQQQLPNKGQGLTITEPRRMNKTEQQQQQQQLPPDDREESVSPVPSRRRKRARRKSTDTEDHLNHHDGASNSSESHQSGSTSAMMTATTTLTTASNKAGTDVPAPIDTKADILAQAAAAQARTNEQPASSSNTVVPNLILKEKQEPAGTSATSASSAASNIISHAEVMLEPKSEYIDDMNEDSIEDLTLDDDDLSNMEGQMEDGAGPSQGHGHGESSQGFGWHMNQGQDEVFMAAQEAVGAHRDSQGPVEPKIRIVSIENLSRKDAQKLLQDESCNKNFPVKIECGTTRQKIIMGQMVNSISKSSIDLSQKPQIKQEIILTPEKDPSQSVATTSTELIITDPIPCTSTITNNPIIHRSVRMPKACNERMKRFFEMTPADLPKTPTRKKYSCEKPILDPPKDRLRCSCGILMERVMMAQHLNTCPKGKIKAQKVYACGGCLFKHSDMAQIDHHVKFCESLKNNKNSQSD